MFFNSFAFAVFWINNPESIAGIIESVIVGEQPSIKSAQQWFELINQHPPAEASSRIWEGIKKIVQ